MSARTFSAGRLLNMAKILIALGLLAFVLTRTGFSTAVFREALMQAHPWWFVLSLPGVLLVLFIKSYRWFLIMKDEQVHYPVFKSYSAYLTSFFIGLLTPGRFGEIVKVYYIRNLSSSGLRGAFQTVLADRFFDLYFLLAAGGISWVLLYQSQEGLLLGLSFGMALAGLLVLAIVLKTLKNFKNAWISFVRDSLFPLAGSRSLKNWGVTLLAYLLYYLQSYVIALSLHIQIGFAELSAVMTLTSAILLLPVTFAGFGAREMSLVVMLGLFQVKPETAVAFSLLQFVSSFAVGGLTGLLFWRWNPVPLESLRQDYQHLKELLKGKKV